MSIKDKIRTLVVEDFGMMRLIISNILVRNPDIEVVATARNGKEGVEKAMLRKPDVIVTDMVMPEYDGMHLVKEVMRSMPTPIVLISALEKDSPQIFEALRAGAFDFVDKPGSGLSMGAGDDYLVKVIKEASKVDAAALKGNRAGIGPVKPKLPPNHHCDIIVMGASTGGPKAVEAILEKLPGKLSVPIIIGQHMPHHHLVSFAERLDGLIKAPVKLAKNEGRIEPGNIYIAQGGSDLKIGKNPSTGEPVMILLDKKAPELEGPSLDRLFASAAEVYGPRVVGVLLTGMGRDGAKGMASINESGGFTIAQDEKSALVFGMPKTAIDMGAVKEVLNLNEISGFILGYL